MGQRGVSILVVAGHDPSGGAGVAADREAGRALGVEVRAVVSTWTQQDGRVLRGVDARPADAWLAEALVELAQRPAALKSGLLVGPAAVEALAQLIEHGRSRFGRHWPVVVDPLLAASGGEELLGEAGRVALLERLLPLGVVLTPNLPEAARLSGLPVASLNSEHEQRNMARALCALGARAVVLKGGHAAGERVQDLLVEPQGPPRRFEHARVRGGGLHGSGCRFASALAAGLARGQSLPDAVEGASRWMGERLELARARGELRP